MLHNRLPFFASLIERELGIVFAESNYFQLQNRLEEIVKFLGLSDVEELYKRTADSFRPDVRQLLLDVATNNETSFFRDPAVFRALQAVILPAALSQVGGSAGISVWSAAASTGQEAYSLAMLLREMGPRGCSSRIIGTDISSRVLERAGQGEFSQLEVQRGLPIQLLPRWFTRTESGIWKVAKELRAMTTFQRFNLLDPFVGLGPFDVVLCRNVLIYQRLESKIQVIQKLERVLKPHGVLILGAGESMLGLSDRFEQVQAPGMTYYRVKAAAALQTRAA